MCSRSPLHLGLLVLLFVGACGRSEPAPSGSNAGAAPSSPPALSADPASASAKAPPALAKERVTAAVERWRVAQETSDFTGYSALYAPSFSGIKRSGPKTTRFDRKGWLADRRDMFRSDTRVALSDLEVFTGERSAFATFEQDWSTARYHDVGKKRLDFVERSGELLITREEMLASQTAAVAGANPPAPEELALLWQLKRGVGVVLKRGKPETRGSARRVPLSSLEQDYYLEKDATEAALRPFARYVGRSFDLYGSAGVVCSATVSGFRAVGGFTSWGVEEPADDVWNALGEHYLVAVLEPEDRKCRALWARASDLPKPSVLPAAPLKGADAKAALSALSRTSVAVARQKAYEEYLAQGGKPERGSPKTWDALEPTAVAATSFTDPASKVSYAVAERSAGESCAEFGGYALGFFKLAEPKWLDLTGNGDPSNELPERPFFGLSPSTAVRLANGRVFMIGSNVVYADAGSGFVPIMTTGRQRTTCGC